MKGKVCLVTGGNRGLGRATATQLAQRGATVIIACRNKASGETARNEIQRETGNAEVRLLPLDLSRPASVRSAVAELQSMTDRLDVLINNAAIYNARRATTPEGWELMFATNHLGPFLLTTALTDLLKRSAPARVIMVTAPASTTLNFGDLQGAQRFSTYKAFGASKMSNLLFTFALAERLAGTGVTVNALHPGLVRSSLMQQAPAIVRWLLPLISRSPEQAAAGCVQLAEAPELAEATGGFYKDGKPIKAADYAYDKAMQQRLWAASEALLSQHAA